MSMGAGAAGPFWVEYYCPRQSPYWQRRQTPLPTIRQAIAEANMMKPPAGAARVLNRYGHQVYTA